MSGDKSQLTTVGYTLVSVLNCCLFTCSAALYISSHLYRLCSFCTHDGSDIGMASAGTLVNCSITLYYSFCTCITSCKTAAAAIASGETFSDKSYSFICFYGEFLSSNTEQQTDDKTYASDYSAGYKYACYIKSKKYHISFLLR